jgi:flagellar motor switch protein FliG
MNRKPNGIRKAAILVATLNRPVADRVLDQMAPSQAQRVRQTIVELGPIDPEEQRQVVEEFYRVRPMVPTKHPPGIELDGRLAQRLGSPQARFSSDETPEPDALSQPFCFLHEAGGEKLARLLAAERPQTIALVLSHLPSRQAGNVLVRLPPPLQVDVIHRLVDLEETDPEILHEVERALESRFSEQTLFERRRVAGLTAVTGILEATDRWVGMRILDNLASRDRRLAERLSPEPVQFDDLVHADGATLSTILQAAEPQLAVLALVGAPVEMVERFLWRLPESEADLLRDRLKHLGPTRLSDVEEARRQIAELAQRMAMEGHIELPAKTAFQTSTPEKSLV